MNRKGFTLIELIAVIVLLGMLLVLTSPYVITAYENSKLKSEELFTNNLSKIIDDYIKLNSDEITFNVSSFNATKSHKYTTNTGNIQTEEYTVKVNRGTIRVQDLIDSTLLLEHKYRNAGNKEATCSNAEIEIYKDSDFVYCHKIEKESLGCLSEKYKDTISGDYVVNTCTWEVTP